ncbi:hypothetical protein TNCV_3275701 [Trichonephila clavipes]|nr:hypothetical protein TNCV_3275701 [Trichonephila clavipes]
MSCTYRWAVMVPRINTRGDRVLLVISPHTITTAVGVSNFLVLGTSPNGGVDVWASRAAHVMSATIPDVLQPGAFVWFESTQPPSSEGGTCTWIAADEAIGCTRAFLKMLWSVEGVLSLVFL